MRLPFVALLCGCFLAAVPPPGAANNRDIAATLRVWVTATSGSVTIQPAGTATPPAVTAENELPANVYITTGDGARVDVALADMGSFTILANSTFSLQTTDDQSIRLLLPVGEALSAVHPAPGIAYEVVTPASSIGIRGTEFAVAAYADGTTEIFVDEGRIELRDQLSGRSLMVGHGQAANTRLGAASYKLTAPKTATNRAAYTFCMCPGGQVIVAASEAGHLVTNGMKAAEQIITRYRP